MADPSRRLEDAMDEYYSRSVLSEDIRGGHVVRPSVVGEVWNRLRQHRICKLVGPPRSGKTYLAFLVGWDIISGTSNSPFSWVRYLDLGAVKDMDEVDQIPREMNRDWLFIIDNCHLTRSCHVRLTRLLKSRWGNVGLLLIETRFPLVKGEEKQQLSSLLQIRQDSSNAPIDTQIYLKETATGMLEIHLRRYFEIEFERTGSTLVENVQAKGGHFDEADYQTVLKTSTEFKSLKDNLRFLSWRLLAWKPRESNLRELSSHEVLETVRQTLVYPFPN
jgi:hypothetical protein